MGITSETSIWAELGDFQKNCLLCQCLLAWGLPVSVPACLSGPHSLYPAAVDRWYTARYRMAAANPCCWHYGTTVTLEVEENMLSR